MQQKLLTNEAIGSVCMALSHLLHSGIGFGDALTLLRADEQDRSLKQILGAMARGMDEGKPLSQVFRESEAFPGYVCTLIRVGEAAGTLEEALESLALYYQNRARLTSRLRSAVVYPTVLLLVLLAVMTVLLVWVLPVFDQVYAQLGTGLTGFAGAMLAFGAGIRKALPVILTVAVLLAGALAIPGIRIWLKKALQSPLGDKGVAAKVNRARFLQALSMAFRSGMTAQEAAETAASLAEIPIFQGLCAQCCRLLAQGASLARALRETGMLSAAQCRLLEAGARSGREELILSQIAGQLLEESEAALERQTEKLEPAMVVAACVLMGSVLLAVLLPLAHIMSAIG